MPVDSFKYLPRLLERYYKLAHIPVEGPVPWTPLEKPLAACRFGLLTSGGLYHRGAQQPFDLEKERRTPTWGDPGYRALPVTVPPQEIGASHLHIHTRSIETDINVLLPLTRFAELVAEGVIGGLTRQAFSVMGYQGFPADLSGWREGAGPQITRQLLAAGADCVLLTAA